MSPQPVRAQDEHDEQAEQVAGREYRLIRTDDQCRIGAEFADANSRWSGRFLLSTFCDRELETAHDNTRDRPGRPHPQIGRWLARMRLAAFKSSRMRSRTAARNSRRLSVPSSAAT